MPTPLGVDPRRCRRGGTLMRKTSLLRDRSDDHCGQALVDTHRTRYPSHDVAVTRCAPRPTLEIARRAEFSFRPNARSDLLFTMSENPFRRSCDHDGTNRFELLDEPKGDPAGGARRDRTDDLLLAKQALSQLSYGPSAPARLRQGDGGQL